MIDFAPNDVSRITPPQEVRRRGEGSRTSMGDYQADATPVEEGLQSGSWRFKRISGQVSGEQSTPFDLPSEWHAERDPLDAASEDRIRLLAKKFEVDLNREELARLEILNARLDRLAPQVTTEDVRMLELMAEKLEGLQGKIDAFANLGLGR